MGKKLGFNRTFYFDFTIIKIYQKISVPQMNSKVFFYVKYVALEFIKSYKIKWNIYIV